jgi:16S rRNA (cytosine1402-N4)-methyltransferase
MGTKEPKRLKRKARAAAAAAATAADEVLAGADRRPAKKKSKCEATGKVGQSSSKKKVTTKLARKLGRAPTEAEVAAYAEKRRERGRKRRQVVAVPVPAPVPSGGTITGANTGTQGEKAGADEEVFVRYVSDHPLHVLAKSEAVQLRCSSLMPGGVPVVCTCRYVPYEATADQLQALFQPHLNVVRVKLMPGREKGLNSGVGFVTFKDLDTARRAVAMFDGAAFMGRSLALCPAKDRLARRPPPLKGLGAATAVPTSATHIHIPPECRSVIVENLVHGCTTKDVRQVFPRATNVVLLGKLGKARVGFSDASSVTRACNVAGTLHAGRRLRVHPDTAKSAADDSRGHEIFLKFLPRTTTEAEVRAFFQDCGTIVGDPTLMRDSVSGQCRGTGFVVFETAAAMAQALSWDQCEFAGRRISITVATQGRGGVRPTAQAPGSHTPALMTECVRSLLLAGGEGVYVDGTFGRGGHSRGLLAHLAPAAQLHAFDLDPEAITVGKLLQQQDPRFVVHHCAFSTMDKVLKPLGLQPHGVLLDLGISSPQFDDAHRGFRPEQDGPLDLRFDQTKGPTAWEYLQTVKRKDLERVLRLYGDTGDRLVTRRVADAICVRRDDVSSGGLPNRTRAFASFIEQVKTRDYQGMHPAKLVFQALRIHINDEFGELRRGLETGERQCEPGR